MSESNTGIPEEFCKVCKDFITDILTTFPEYKDDLHQGLIDIIQDIKDTEPAKEVFDYVKEVYPERFFDYFIKMRICLLMTKLIQNFYQI